MTKNNDLPDEILVAWSGGSLSTMTVFTEIFDEKLKSRAVEYVRKDLSPPVPDDVAAALDFFNDRPALGMTDLGYKHFKTILRAASTPSPASDVDPVAYLVSVSSRGSDYVCKYYFTTLEEAHDDIRRKYPDSGAKVTPLYASTPSPSVKHDICEDCGSPMMEVCSGLEKISREGCIPSLEAQAVSEVTVEDIAEILHIEVDTRLMEDMDCLALAYPHGIKIKAGGE